MVLAERTSIDRREVLIHTEGRELTDSGNIPPESTNNGTAQGINSDTENVFFYRRIDRPDPISEIPLFVDGRFNELRFETPEESRERERTEGLRKTEQVTETALQVQASQNGHASEYILPEHAAWRAERAQEDPVRLAEVIARSAGHNRIPVHEPVRGLEPSQPEPLMHTVELIPGLEVDFHPAQHPSEAPALKLAS